MDPIPHFPHEEHCNELQAHDITDISSVEPTPQFDHEEGPKELNEHGIADVSSTPTGLHLPVRRLPLAEILPIPRVPQTGPRNRKTNRLGQTRVLTNEDVFEIIQEDEARRREKE